MRRTTVLIADDSPAIRDGLASILSVHADLEVVGTAVDGADAVRRAAELRPDIVLMDAQMPVMDGMQATREIKQQQGDRTRVLFLTVHAGYLQRGLDAGADAALLKDVQRADLLRTLRGLVANEGEP